MMFSSYVFRCIFVLMQLMLPIVLLYLKLSSYYITISLYFIVLLKFN